MSVVIEAQRASECTSCTFGIRPGQKIQPLPDGGWEHVRCPEARQVCSACFTEIPPSGSCLCEVI